eukprot:c33541_g1_i1.p1 GENE.c33541_g1_i1~~c33541_g1_i1.p1  ORF type:complete len:244 (-),score=123.89 c33541_g1_i1:178-909(-)
MFARSLFVLQKPSGILSHTKATSGGLLPVELKRWVNWAAIAERVQILTVTQTKKRSSKNTLDAPPPPSQEALVEAFFTTKVGSDGEIESSSTLNPAPQQVVLPAAPPPREAIRDALGRSYGTGKRKTSIARVWVYPGSGSIQINGKPLVDYVPYPTRREDVLNPLVITESLGKMNVKASVEGGGLTGQAQAVRHGLAKALQNYNPEFRPALRAAGFLTRDARVVERKKPGQKKARKKFQWAKR